MRAFRARQIDNLSRVDGEGGSGRVAVVCLRLVRGSFASVCLWIGLLAASSCRSSEPAGATGRPPVEIAAATTAAVTPTQILAAVQALPGSPAQPALASGFVTAA